MMDSCQSEFLQIDVDDNFRVCLLAKTLFWALTDEDEIKKTPYLQQFFLQMQLIL